METDLLLDDPRVPSVGPIELLPAENLLINWIRRELNIAEDHVERFRKQYRQARRFFDGKQLTDEDKRILDAQQRPNNIFNSAQKFVRFVTGVERVAPEALIFNAIDENDETQQAFGEFTTRSFDWAIKMGKGVYERSTAFEDLIIGGMGWEDYAIHFGKDPRGLPNMERFNPCEAFWQQTERQNLEGARWRARERLIDADEAKSRWPEEKFFINMALALADTNNRPEPNSPVIYEIPYIQTKPITSMQLANVMENKVQILQFEWFDDEPGYYFYDPLEREDVWFNDSDFATYRKRLRLLTGESVSDYVRRPSRQYKRVFILNRRHQLGEIIKLKQFHLNCMTGHYDEDEKHFYGYFRVLIDPQKYANRFFNQLLEITGRTAKGGGFLYEKGAIHPNQVDAFSNEYAKPGTSQEVQQGAISGKRIMPKPQGELPTATMGLLQTTVSMMEEVTGIAPDQYGGGQSANVPNVTLRQKGKNSLLLLAPEFDALSRFRYDEGYIVLDLLETLADDRLIQVGGHADSAVVRLIHEPFVREYNLSLDDTERDPNIRRLYEENVMQLAPTLIRMNMFLPELLDYMRIPFRFKQKLKQAIQQLTESRRRDAMAGVPQGGRSSPVTPQERAAKVQKIQAETAVQMARAKRLEGQTKRDEVRTVMEALVKAMEVALEKERHGREGVQLAVDLFQQALGKNGGSERRAAS